MAITKYGSYQVWQLQSIIVSMSVTKYDGYQVWQLLSMTVIKYGS